MQAGPVDLKILYVEDDATIRESTAKFLERRFRHVYYAENGLEGLRKFEEHRPDIVMTDIQMPVMGGLEMAAQIKQISPAVPIVVMSAYSESHYLLSAIEMGIDRYILKPVDKKRLVSTLDDLVSIRLNELKLAEKSAIIDQILKGDPCLVVLSQSDSVRKINKMMWAIVGKQLNGLENGEELKLHMLPITAQDGSLEWFERVRELNEGEALEVKVCCEPNSEHVMRARLLHFPICNLDLITFSSDEIQLPC